MLFKVIVECYNRLIILQKFSYIVVYTGGNTMNLKEFCQGIHLPEEALVGLLKRELSQEDYEHYKELFIKDRNTFNQEVLKQDRPRELFLYLYCRLGADSFELYREQSLPENVFWDTFSDFTIWCKTCYKKYGEYGIQEYNWLCNHIQGKLLRLGRLQFEEILAKEDICFGDTTIAQGSFLINVHIPEGEPLLQDSCDESFHMAKSHWSQAKAFVCESWLLYANLSKILPAHSNILSFQKRFTTLEIIEDSEQGEERIFGQVLENKEEYPENTTLQASAKKYLLSGEKIGSGYGIILIAD